MHLPDDQFPRQRVPLERRIVGAASDRDCVDAERELPEAESAASAGCVRRVRAAARHHLLGRRDADAAQLRGPRGPRDRGLRCGSVRGPRGAGPGQGVGVLRGDGQLALEPRERGHHPQLRLRPHDPHACPHHHGPPLPSSSLLSVMPWSRDADPACDSATMYPIPGYCGAPPYGGTHRDNHPRLWCSLLPLAVRY
eukprot:723065-Rhodomonas_salina.4